MTFVAAFLAALIAVFLKATQQRQVMAAEYSRMPAVSIGMAFCEVFIISNVIHAADSVPGLVLLALCIGTGGAIGSILGVWLHAKTH